MAIKNLEQLTTEFRRAEEKANQKIIEAVSPLVGVLFPGAESAKAKELMVGYNDIVLPLLDAVDGGEVEQNAAVFVGVSFSVVVNALRRLEKTDGQFKVVIDAVRELEKAAHALGKSLQPQ